MSAMTNAEKQRAFRERLLSRLSPEELIEYKEKKARYARLRYRIQKFFERFQSQCQEWGSAIKKHLTFDEAVYQVHMIEAPVLVLHTPFFEEIAVAAELEPTDVKFWETLYYGLSVWPLVASNHLDFVFQQETIKKLVDVGAIKYQENNGFGLSVFVRGRRWPYKNEYESNLNIPFAPESSDYSPPSVTPFQEQ